MPLEGSPQGAPRRNLDRVLHYIATHNTGNISLATLAGIAGLTPHHFSSLFKTSTGLSPHQYVLRERITRARLYLQDGALSVGQISRLTGFRTQEHFTKVFRKIVGLTPTKFRENHPEAERSK